MKTSRILIFCTAVLVVVTLFLQGSSFKHLSQNEMPLGSQQTHVQSSSNQNQMQKNQNRLGDQGLFEVKEKRLAKYLRLADSKNANDQFLAYQTLNECQENELLLKDLRLRPKTPENEEERQRLEPDALKLELDCEGISFTQKTRRRDHLEKALEADVKGAAAAYLYDGPLGDQSAILTRPSDPLVIAWKERAVEKLERAASNGDKSTFLPLYQLYDDGPLVSPNYYKALIYVVAIYELKSLEKGNLSEQKPKSLVRLEGMLSDEEIRNATRIGKELAKITVRSDAEMPSR